jgi:hypothetical protein
MAWLACAFQFMIGSAITIAGTANYYNMEALANAKAGWLVLMLMCRSRQGKARTNKMP